MVIQFCEALETKTTVTTQYFSIKHFKVKVFSTFKIKFEWKLGFYSNKSSLLVIPKSTINIASLIMVK